MLRFPVLHSTVLLAVALSACGSPRRPTSGDDGGNNSQDGAGEYTVAPPDAGDCVGTMPYRCDLPLSTNCGAVELCSASLGYGVDDNCDGRVDEDCGCVPGEVQPCYTAPPGHVMTGACAAGQQTCIGMTEFGTWGPCVGGIRPSTESCDRLDNDCNGCTDEDLCCGGDLNCPGPGDPRVPEAAPFTDYVLHGTDFYTGGGVFSWSWTVEGGPCDRLFSASGAPPDELSYTLSGQNTADLTIHFTLSGDYTVTMTVTTDTGVYTCTFLVHVGGPGLRIELCWDTAPQTDIDLHLHRPATFSDWFGSGTFTISPDDCYYINCTAAQFVFPSPFGGTPDWGKPNTALANCQGGPLGAEWAMYGACHNPRLDIDNVCAGWIPENINIDNPGDGETYRAMVHYYGGGSSGCADLTTHPLLNVYCGGSLVATYGEAPDVLGGFNHGDGWNAGLMWRVVDVTTHVAGGVTTCDVTALHPPGMVAGYWMTNNVSTY